MYIGISIYIYIFIFLFIELMYRERDTDTSGARTLDAEKRRDSQVGLLQRPIPLSSGRYLERSSGVPRKPLGSL